jgi:hypothetical protein
MKRDEIGETCNTHGKNYAIQHFRETFPEGKTHLWRLSLRRNYDIKMDLKGILYRVYTSVQWLSIGCIGELL